MRSLLKTAMAERDRATASLCRSVLGAIDNAEARPVSDLPAAGAVEGSAIGVGAADLARRQLTGAEVHAVFEEEISERRYAAEAVAEVDPDRAAVLRREAELLASVLEGPGAQDSFRVPKV